MLISLVSVGLSLLTKNDTCKEFPTLYTIVDFFLFFPFHLLISINNFFCFFLLDPFFISTLHWILFVAEVWMGSQTFLHLNF